ncbi:cyclic di-GMP-binding protein BdcA [Weissella oryzae SG25]|uniref:Cyclic di-GMP-binding protein BdcA n=1 Tax=Weissella oryzae (strain DSM 25784 / JCM 18191 / LMG 30913 / SG25) TaxID=1329250 RepID=A0A069CU34_WEIOS|nr:DUF1003 domain-containing protein [Weissella oryzae]GAK31270.1 cyclic di-GMP-binding protein BdcA [Weissella oryzae SG25]
MAVLKYQKDLIDGKNYPVTDGVFLTELDGDLFAIIRKDNPKASRRDFITYKHLTNYRLKKLDVLLAKDFRENDRFHERFAKMADSEEYQEIDVRKHLDETLTFGQRIADGVARFGGSWTFIISFLVFMLVWMLINTLHLFGVHFDPYPFILLNLALSMIAALQAPLIMMSQNRSAEYDRLESTNGYRINRKSEAEIRLLHSKLDHLMQQDQADSLEVQRLQVEILASITNQLAEIQRR